MYLFSRGKFTGGMACKTGYNSIFLQYESIVKNLHAKTLFVLVLELAWATKWDLTWRWVMSARERSTASENKLSNRTGIRVQVRAAGTQFLLSIFVNIRQKELEDKCSRLLNTGCMKHFVDPIVHVHEQYAPESSSDRFSRKRSDRDIISCTTCTA